MEHFINSYFVIAHSSASGPLFKLHSETVLLKSSLIVPYGVGEFKYKKPVCGRNICHGENVDLMC